MLFYSKYQFKKKSAQINKIYKHYLSSFLNP